MSDPSEIDCRGAPLMGKSSPRFVLIMPYDNALSNLSYLTFRVYFFFEIITPMRLSECQDKTDIGIFMGLNETA
jgi:hypothetical protein